MVADLLFRVACQGGGDEPLNVHLKRITDSAYTRKTLGGADIDGDLIAPVVAESHDVDCRREIMRHLRECLSEDGNGKRWQRIYGGLALTDKLMQHGSPDLLIEVARGHHFDLVQKVSFLERFDAAARGCSDRRAQKVIREKASEVNTRLVEMLDKARAEDLQSDNLEKASNCSWGEISTATPSTAASSAQNSPSSECSMPEPRTPSTPTKDVHIDDAFAALREWMESVDSNDASPRSSAGESLFSLDDLDWEPLESLPPAYIAAMQAKPSGDVDALAGMSDGIDDDDVFFTPMPAPAFVRPPMRVN